MIKLKTSYEFVQVVSANKKLVDGLLMLNSRNRKVNQSVVTDIRDKIVAGAFLLTGDAVVVSNTGVLLNGQHRLLAIKMAKYPPVRFVLCTGFDDASQKAMDRHSRRTIYNALTMSLGKSISAKMVAIVTTLRRYQLAVDPSHKFKWERGAVSVSDEAIESFVVAHHKLLVEIMTHGSNLRASILAPIFIYAFHDRDAAIKFTVKVSKGLGLQESDPAYRLRAALERLKSVGGHDGQLEIIQTTAAAIIADHKGALVERLRLVESWESAKWKPNFLGLFYQKLREGDATSESAPKPEAEQDEDEPSAGSMFRTVKVDAPLPRGVKSIVRHTLR